MTSMTPNSLFLLALMIPLFPPAMDAQEHPRGETTLTVLFDNFTDDGEMETGWGFSVLIETGGHTILFDTGADGDVLLRNMRRVGKDPLAVEAVVISHAHSDHTGGIEALLATGVRPKLFLLPGFPAELREIGGSSLEKILATPGQEIIPGLLTTGEVEGPIPEQALILETRDGPLVLTGCAHPGPETMVERAAQVVGTPVTGILGGFHLVQTPLEEVRGIIDSFRARGIAITGATHCTGEEAMALFQEAWGEGYLRLGVGRVLRFPES